jgi:hypothetical protein
MGRIQAARIQSQAPRVVRKFAPDLGAQAAALLVLLDGKTALEMRSAGGDGPLAAARVGGRRHRGHADHVPSAS